MAITVPKATTLKSPSPVEALFTWRSPAGDTPLAVPGATRHLGRGGVVVMEHDLLTGAGVGVQAPAVVGDVHAPNGRYVRGYAPTATGGTTEHRAGSARLQSQEAREGPNLKGVDDEQQLRPAWPTVQRAAAAHGTGGAKECATAGDWRPP
jgi:hypothetical protein